MYKLKMMIPSFVLALFVGLIGYALIMSIPWSRKNVTNVIISTIPMALLVSYILYYNVRFEWHKKGFDMLRTRYVVTSS